MIIDLQTKVSDAQAVTATAISANVIDLRNAATPVKADEGLTSLPGPFLVIQVQTTCTAAGAATVTFTLESADDAGLTTNATVHWSSVAIGKATLVAGYTVCRIPLPLDDYRRYLGVRYTVGTGPLTAGAFHAFFPIDVQRNVIYANGFAVA